MTRNVASLPVSGNDTRFTWTYRETTNAGNEDFGIGFYAVIMDRDNSDTIVAHADTGVVAQVICDALETSILV